jgi:phosphoglycolate phosphatase-like HAD superfamily hydrolase
LANYEIGALFADAAVIDKQAGRDKRTHLRALADKFDVDFGEITFIDDKVNHLVQAQALGVRCLLAEWGYNGAREHEVARQNGIEVANLENLEQKLFGS